MDNDLTRVVDALPGLSTDIQERKHTEPEGRVGDLSFQLVVDCIPGLVAVTKPNGEMEYANAELLEYFGKTLDALNRSAQDVTERRRSEEALGKVRSELTHVARD